MLGLVWLLSAVSAAPVFDPFREAARIFFPRRLAMVVAAEEGATSNT